MVVGCGEPAADSGARWDLRTPNATQPGGQISLRSDPSLCLARLPLPTAPARAVRESGRVGESDPMVGATQIAISIAWNTTGHASSVKLSSNDKLASWTSAPGRTGCDTVALGTSERAASSFWVRLLPDQSPGAGMDQGASYADIGWCVPSIRTSGDPHWAGSQLHAAWLYRAMDGNFKVGGVGTLQGQPYGPAFGIGSNVTAVRHSPTSLEFFLNGHSNGKITLPAAQALRADAVPCAGVCSHISLEIMSGVAPVGPAGPPPPPPPPPPAPPPTVVALAKCVEGEASQQWVMAAGKILSGGEGAGGLQMGAGAAGDFAPVTAGGAAATLWWSPDLGYLHGDSNHPMLCNCVAICG